MGQSKGLGHSQTSSLEVVTGSSLKQLEAAGRLEAKCDPDPVPTLLDVWILYKSPRQLGAIMQLIGGSQPAE